MIRTFEELGPALRALLTPQERDGALAYALERPLPEGTKLHFPGLDLEVPAEAYLAFVDRQPTANWGHSARYLLLGREGGTSWSFEARFPPFAEGGERWRLIHRAPSVPDAALAFPP